jgi:hypothetical protein
MLKIEVAKSVERRNQGTNRTTGKPFDFRTQVVWVHTYDRDGEPEAHPTKIEVFLDDDQVPYPVGVYTLHPSAIYVDRTGRLAISPRLAPMKKADAPATR